MQIKNLISSFGNRLNYFGDHSSIHGMRFIFSTKPLRSFKRFLWLILVIVSAIGMLYILNQAADFFQNKTISFVPETTYLHWSTDFPAITVCENADPDKIIDFYEENKVPVRLAAFYDDVIFLNTRRYCRSCSSCKENNCPEDFTTIMNQYRSPCNETIIRCSWRDEVFNCCERFVTMLTEYGQCFVFNSQLFGGERIHLSNKETGPGYLKFTAMETVEIDVHSPDDVFFSDFDKLVNGNDAKLTFGSEFVLRLKVEETNNDDEVVEVDIEKRKCRFSHELPSIPFMYSRYSYSTCIVHCRALQQLAECNCTHHMLPRVDNEPTCDIKGLVCLTVFYEKSDRDELDIKCKCLPSCTEPEYEVVLLNNKPNKGDLTDELIERGTIISIYIELIPSIRNRRTVVRSHLDHVVFIGGTAAVFFGASILSILEVVYLLFIRKHN